MMQKALAFAVVLAAYLHQSASAAGADPATLQRFAGNWNGSWDGTLPITLVIDPVTPPTAHVIYEWGIDTAANINNPGFIRRTGHFEDDRLVLSLPSGEIGIFVLQADGTLSGIAGGTVGGTILGPVPPRSGVIHATLTRQ